MLKKILKIILTILKNPKTLLRVLSPTEEESKNQVLNKYALNHGLPIVQLQDFVVNENHLVSPYLFLEGGSLPTDHFLLAQIAAQDYVKTYFEIGTWRGESVMNVEPFVEKAYTLNLSDQELEKRGTTADYVKQSGMLIPEGSNKVVQLYGDSLSFDFSPWEKTCDLVFVDGDHHYHNVLSDTKKALKLLREKNSVLVWHDYGFSPEEIRWETLLAILDAIPAAEHRYLYHVAHTKCAVYCCKPLKAALKGRPLRPDTLFEVGLKMKKFE